MSEKEELLGELDIYAQKNNIQLNPEEAVVSGIVEGLLKNKKLYGYLYCPCRWRKEQENICPCSFHKEELKKFGKCLCGLFVKK